MAAKELLTSKKIAEQLGLPASAVTNYLKASGTAPDETKGGCGYYGPKTVKAVEKALLLTAGSVAKQLGVKPADVTKAITAAGIAPDRVAGACKYYGPAAVKVIQKALK